MNMEKQEAPTTTYKLHYRRVFRVNGRSVGFAFGCGESGGGTVEDKGRVTCEACRRHIDPVRSAA